MALGLLWCKTRFRVGLMARIQIKFCVRVKIRIWKGNCQRALVHKTWKHSDKMPLPVDFQIESVKIYAYRSNVVK